MIYAPTAIAAAVASIKPLRFSWTTILVPLSVSSQAPWCDERKLLIWTDQSNFSLGAVQPFLSSAGGDCAGVR